MANFINEHKTKRIVKYRPGNINLVEVGNIIWFKYPQSKNNNNPHVLVINKNWLNKLHGLVIDYMSLLQLERFRDFVIEEAEEVKPNTPDRMKDSLYQLTKESQTPKTFYDVRLKPYLKKYFPNTSIYRTYDIPQINNIKIAVYNFGGPR